MTQINKFEEVNTVIASQKFSNALENSKYEFENFFLANFFDLNFSYTEETCTVEFQVEDFMYNPRRFLHGGVISFIMDVSMGHLCNKVMGIAVTIEMKVQYLKAVNTGNLKCKASFLKMGKSIAYVESRMTDERGNLIAMATATFKKVIDRRPER